MVEIVAALVGYQDLTVTSPVNAQSGGLANLPGSPSSEAGYDGLPRPRFLRRAVVGIIGVGPDRHEHCDSSAATPRSFLADRPGSTAPATCSRGRRCRCSWPGAAPSATRRAYADLRHPTEGSRDRRPAEAVDSSANSQGDAQLPGTQLAGHPAANPGSQQV